MAKKAVRLSPGLRHFYNTLGVAHYSAGQWKEALVALAESMRRRAGGDGYDWFFIAMAKWQLGQKDEARKWYEKATRMEIKDPELKRFRDEAAQLLGIANQK